MNWITELVNWLRANIDFPAVILIVLLGTVGFFLWKAQRSATNTFDLKDMFLDENGKVSSMRFSLLVAMCISSWAIMVMVMKDQLDPTAFIGYIAFWSGSAVAAKFVEAYQSVKGAPPPTQ